MKNAYLSQLKWAKLTPEDVTKRYNHGETILHMAAEEGLWEKIPKPLRDKKYWRKTDNGSTIYMYAAASPDMSWIDPNDLTELELTRKNKSGNDMISIAITQGNFDKLLKQIPKELLTENILKEKSQVCDLVIHIIARTGQLKELPDHLLTEEILSLKCPIGAEETVYHILAKEGRLKDLPKELLTPKGLSAQDATGDTPLFYMVQNEPYLIPKELLTPEFMLQEHSGETPLHLWATSDYWEDIPEELLTRQTLKSESYNGASLLTCLVEKYNHERPWAEGEEGIKKMDRIFLRVVKVSSETDLKKLQEKLKADEPNWDTLGVKSTVSLIQDELNKRKIVEKLRKTELSFEL